MFRLRRAPQHQFVTPVRTPTNRLATLGSVPRTAPWLPPPVRVADPQGLDSPADFPWWVGNALLLRSSAVEVVGGLLDGELLPLDADDGLPLFIYEPPLLDDVLDEKESDVLRFSSDRVRSIDEWVFRPNLPETAHAFKLSVFPRGPMLVSQRFVEVANEHKLTGLTFEKVHPHPEPV